MLSNSVAKALPLVVGEKASETAKFAAIFNKFFDILNVGNFKNGTRYRNPNLHPYRHGEDERLKVLTVNASIQTDKSPQYNYYYHYNSGWRSFSYLTWTHGKLVSSSGKDSVELKKVS